MWLKKTLNYTINCVVLKQYHIKTNILKYSDVIKYQSWYYNLPYIKLFLISVYVQNMWLWKKYICCNLRGNRYEFHTVIVWNMTPLQTPQTQGFTSICSNIVHPRHSFMYEKDSLQVTLKRTAKSMLSFGWWQNTMLLRKIKAATCHMLLHLSKISILWWQAT